MIRAAIFDFDGLIVDTEWPAYMAWSSIFQRFNHTLPLEKWVQAVGTFHGFDPVTYLGSLTGESHDSKELFAEKERLKAETCSRAPLLPGVTELLSQARKLKAKTAVVSTSERFWVESHLRRVGIWDEFDYVVTREDVTKVKPDPEPYLKVAQKMGLAPADCVVFEDSMNGVLAAKAAGMKCFVVPNRVTEFLDFSVADARLSSLKDVKLHEI
jgi:HAD superfamily hydrolase (TIGR01509 family)